MSKKMRRGIVGRTSGKTMVTRILSVKCYRLIGWIFFSALFLYVIDFSGVLRHLQERSFDREFVYPLESKNFVEIVNSFRLGQNINIPPINNLYQGIPIKSDRVQTCDGQDYILLILVKTAPAHGKLRQAIRETWKVSANERASKLAFFIGGPKLEDENEKEALVRQINDEVDTHKDIVLLGFEDSYYNNTIKTMLEMRWAVENCSSFQYALLVDDDYFVSVKNLLRFIENPKGYPEKSSDPSSIEKLYAGYKMFPPPHRHKIMTKWFVTLEEYPYDYFPPYITAGAILLSKEALSDIYYASFYTAHFRFDDVYIAICAKKMNITPLNSEYFRFWSTRDESPEEFLIASHGFSDPERLRRFWHSQKAYGFC